MFLTRRSYLIIYMDEDLFKTDKSMTVTITEQTLKVTALGGEDAEEAEEMFEAMGLELPWELHKK